MNSQTLSIPTAIYKKTSKPLNEKALLDLISPTGIYVPSPVKKIILSFWKVWTAKID